MLVICAAGTHQLWGYALTDVGIKMRGNLTVKRGKNTAWRLAGDGKEMNRNNTYAEKASFAQPSGITFDGKDTLYIADAEGSAVRMVTLPSFGVKNVAGGGLDPTDLFSYGDENGRDLNEPGGISYDKYTGSLYIADTNSHRVLRRHDSDGRVKVLDLKKGRPILSCPGKPVTFLNIKVTKFSTLSSFLKFLK
eukprot:sb/3471012/